MPFPLPLLLWLVVGPFVGPRFGLLFILGLLWQFGLVWTVGLVIYYVPLYYWLLFFPFPGDVIAGWDRTTRWLIDSLFCFIVVGLVPITDLFIATPYYPR